jgi:hypothetical protein
MTSGSKRGAVEVVFRWHINKLYTLAARRCTASTLFAGTPYAECIYIQKNLSWDSHIDKITKKANSTLAFLGRNVSRCPTTIKALCYTTLVRSTRSSCVWYQES